MTNFDLCYLYLSHSVTTFDSRIFKFGSVLFVSVLYPKTLFPVSVYALATALPGTLFAPQFGKYVASKNRLRIVRWSIIVPRLVVLLSCLLFYFPRASEAVMLTLFSVLGSVESFFSIVNSVIEEQNWIVTVTGDNVGLREHLDTRMRIIDLICELIGSLVIGCLQSCDYGSAIAVVFSTTCSSLYQELWFIGKLKEFWTLPNNQMPPLSVEPTRNIEHRSLLTDNNIEVFDDKKEQGLFLVNEKDFSFWKHPLMPASLSLAMTYITVLAFSGPMISYLLATGMSVPVLTLFCTGSVLMELGSTFLSRLVVPNLGAGNSALLFITFQFATLTLTIVSFLKCDPSCSSIVLSIGVVISRIGFAGFGVSTQLFTQSKVQEFERKQFVTYEKSLQNWAMILAFASTMTFTDSSQFIWPMLLSVASVGAALLVMSWHMFNGK